MKDKTKIVIVGGGFGGVYTARGLSDMLSTDQAEVTIINSNNYFLFTPLLHEVATGGLTPDSIVEPLREVFRGTAVSVVEDIATEIDTAQKTVKTANGIYNYDYLVISAGAETNYFNISGAREHSFTLKNLEDAVALRNHIVDTCEKAVKTKDKNLLTTAIVGAGPTGVELAAELAEYMQHTICTYYKDSGFTKDDIKVSIITATHHILPQFPEEMCDLAAKELQKKGVDIVSDTIAEKVEPGLLIFKDGSTLKAHTLVWVAGVTPSLSNIKGVTTGAKGRIEINEYLQTTQSPEVFALGDASGTLPMLAQVAVQQGGTVAKNICKLMEGRIDLDKFTFRQKGLLISVGQWYAIGHFGNEKRSFTLRGRFMWWMWRTIYLFNFLSWRKKFEISMEWTINLFYPRDISSIK